MLLEGIENKIKKLLVLNNGLRERISNLEEQKLSLMDQIETQKLEISELREYITHLQAAKAVKGKDSLQARQKVNELLREIEKCYGLLNSQAK